MHHSSEHSSHKKNCCNSDCPSSSCGCRKELSPSPVDHHEHDHPVGELCSEHDCNCEKTHLNQTEDRLNRSHSFGNFPNDHDHDQDHDHDHDHDHGHSHHNGHDSELDGCEEGCGCEDKKPASKDHSHARSAKSGSCEKGCCGSSNSKAKVDHDHGHDHDDAKSDCCVAEVHDHDHGRVTLGGCEKGCCGSSNTKAKVDHDHGHDHDDAESDSCDEGCGCDDKKPIIDHDHGHSPVVASSSCEKGCCGATEAKANSHHGHSHSSCCSNELKDKQVEPPKPKTPNVSLPHPPALKPVTIVNADMEAQTVIAPFVDQSLAISEKLVCNFCDPSSPVVHAIQVTRFRVANLCCVKEEHLLRKTLENVTGVEHVSVNLVGKYAIIKHCNVQCCAPSAEIARLLNDKHLGVSVQDIHSHGEGGNDSEDEHLGWLPILHSALVTILFIIGLIFNFVPQADTSSSSHHIISQWVYVACVIIGGFPILKDAGISLFIQREIDIHCLMIIAIIGACVGKEYFDAGLVIVLFVNAQLLEAYMMMKVKKAINLTSSKTLPKEAYLTDGKTVKVADLKINDVVAIRAGEMIFCDGTIVKGEGVIDESALTGESVPVQKKANDKVFGGTIIQNGYLEIKITANPQDSLINRLNATVEEVQADLGHYATLVNQFSQYWTPFVIVATAVLVVIGGSVTSDWWLYTNRGLVLLVLACPCAIVISAPIPAICAISNAAKHGILIRGSTIVEKLNTIDTIATDKTGTVTKGFFTVNEKLCLREDLTTSESIAEVIEEAMLFAASLEQKSTHPLANAIISDYCGCVAEMDEMMSKFPETKKIKIIDGVGLEGWIQDPTDKSQWKAVVVGNERLFKGFGGKLFLSKKQTKQIQDFQTNSIGKVLLFVVIDDEPTLLLSLSDEIRSESKEFIHLLQSSMHYPVMMLTGDHDNVAKNICSELSILDSNCYSRLLPEDKLNYIIRHQAIPESIMNEPFYYSFLKYFFPAHFSTKTPADQKNNNNHNLHQLHENGSHKALPGHDIEEGIALSPLYSKSNGNNSKEEEDNEVDEHLSSKPLATGPSSSSPPLPSVSAAAPPAGHGHLAVHSDPHEGNQKILYIGDGINDSTALAASTVGVAMGANGSAMAVTAADVVLMTDNLLLIPYSISISQYACRTIFENGAFAVAVKIVAVVLAIMGMLDLWEAVLIDVGSLIVVVLNGMKVLRFTDKRMIKA